MFKLISRHETSRKPSHSPNERLKIRTLQVPKALSDCGARHVQFSPDGKWLLVVQPNSTVLLYRIIKCQDSKTRSEILEMPVELHRRKRSLPSTSQPLDGTLGEYQTLICRVAWSSDSRIVACGDLSGKLDVWILQGDEQPPDQISMTTKPSTNGYKRGARNSSESSDSSDEDESTTDDSKPVLGQIWSRPRSELPNLSSFPLILSFHPPGSVTQELRNKENRPDELSLKIHDNRRLANGVDKLVAVTALHEIYEFEVLSGRLSNWSRRNPPTQFPPEFMRDKERAMGCVWDTYNNKKRFWVYSSTALWMFDMSRDFPKNISSVGPRNQTTIADSEDAQSRKGRKRKRSDDEAQWQVSHGQTSGAGDKVRAPLIWHGFGDDVRTMNTDDVETARETDRMDLDQQDGFEGSSNEEDEAPESSANNRSEAFSTLVQRRRANGADENISPPPYNNQTQTNGFPSYNHMTNGVNEDYIDRDGAEGIRNKKGSDIGEITAVVKPDPNQAQGPSIHFWRTYQYRPILGIVPLGKIEDHIASGIDDAEAPDLEVALVERPLWQTDLDLPWDSHH